MSVTALDPLIFVNDNLSGEVQPAFFTHFCKFSVLLLIV